MKNDMKTLNEEYNLKIKEWGIKPECEECGKSLVGKNVFYTGMHWICQKCNEEWNNEGMTSEDFNFR